MNTFRNKNWTGKRNYECTNKVFCVGNQAPDSNWIECQPEELEALLEKGAYQLYMQNDVRFYGWL